MSKEYSNDYLVYVGRFQPLHDGHMDVIRTALTTSKRLLILVGSTNSSRCPHNPWTFAERRRMILQTLRKEYTSAIEDRVSILPVPDSPYIDDRWKANVQRIVNNAIVERGDDPNRCQIGLIGFAKDHTSYYLKMFPMWGSVNVPMVRELSATDIREKYFTGEPDVENVPDAVAHYLNQFVAHEEFDNLVDWFEYDRNYRKTVQVGPFPVQIICADAVVVQSGHILLVERAAMPGRGLLALPGGHVNTDETFRAAAIRELKEETRIEDNYGEIPPAKLGSFIDDTQSRIFDSPKRSSKARVVTYAFLFRLPDAKQLYKVRGEDDAASAKWYPLGSLKANDFFDDHFHVLEALIGSVS